MRLPITPYGRSDCFALAALFSVLAAGALCGAAVGDAPRFGLLAIPPLLGAALVAWFFRDPERTVPSGPGLLVSPADGTVTDMAVVREEEFLHGDALRIGIFLSPLNVHVNRSPCAGRVEHVRHRPGAFGPAFGAEAAARNESCSIGIAVEPGERDGALRDGVRVLVRQVVGALARRIVCPLEPGDRLARGERFGMIKLGSRTELWVPVSVPFEPRVSVGDTVWGGATVLGVLGCTSDASLADLAAPNAKAAERTEVGSCA